METQYREVKASKRTPKEREEVHLINNGFLTTGYYQDGQWYIGEHETACIKFSGVWLEPINQPTVEEIEFPIDIIKEQMELLCDESRWGGKEGEEAAKRLQQCHKAIQRLYGGGKESSPPNKKGE